METDNLAYWVNPSHGEWGTVDLLTAEKLGKRRGFVRTSGRHGVQGWVDSFVAAMKKDGTFLLTQDREEFRFLYRCFESLSGPLVYCPIAPRTPATNRAPISTGSFQLAA